VVWRRHPGGLGEHAEMGVTVEWDNPQRFPAIVTIQQ
jgi:hypothetical protein